MIPELILTTSCGLSSREKGSMQVAQNFLNFSRSEPYDFILDWYSSLKYVVSISPNRFCSIALETCKLLTQLSKAFDIPFLLSYPLGRACNAWLLFRLWYLTRLRSIIRMSYCMLFIKEFKEWILWHLYQINRCISEVIKMPSCYKIRKHQLYNVEM